MIPAAFVDKPLVVFKNAPLAPAPDVFVKCLCTDSAGQDVWYLLCILAKYDEDASAVTLSTGEATKLMCRLPASFFPTKSAEAEGEKAEQRVRVVADAVTRGGQKVVGRLLATNGSFAGEVYKELRDSGSLAIEGTRTMMINRLYPFGLLLAAKTSTISAADDELEITSDDPILLKSTEPEAKKQLELRDDSFRRY